MSADREERILDAVRLIREKLNILTNEGQREIVELLETSVVLYRKEGIPWCHIDVSLTEQDTDLPIASPHAWAVHPLVSSLRHVLFLEQTLSRQEGLCDKQSSEHGVLSIGRYVLTTPIILRIEVGPVPTDN